MGLNPVKAMKSAWRGCKRRTRHRKNVHEDDIGMAAEMSHARLGVLYLWANTRFDSSEANICLEGVLGGVLGAMSVNGNANENDALKNAAKIAKPCLYPVTKLQKIAQGEAVKLGKGTRDGRVYNIVTQRLEELWKAFCKKLDEKARTDMKLYWGMIKSVISSIAGIIASELKVGDIMTLIKGATQTVSAGLRLMDSWMERRSNSWIIGHPTATIEAISVGLRHSLGKGMWNIIKGSSGIALKGAAPWVGPFVKMMASAVETVIKLLWRLYEFVQINNFIKDAKDFWACRNLWTFHEDAEAFTDWFRSYTLRAPIIGVVTLNSRWTGAAMHFMNHYGGDNKTPLSPKDYKAGLNAIAKLKAYGADYWRETGYEFFSDSKLVQSDLKYAKDIGKVGRFSDLRWRDHAYAALAA